MITFEIHGGILQVAVSLYRQPSTLSSVWCVINKLLHELLANGVYLI